MSRTAGLSWALAALLGVSSLTGVPSETLWALQAPSDLARALLQPEHPLWREPAPATFRVRLETTQGDFVIEAHRAWAPHGVDRFYHLVRTGFYDDSRFFRVRPRWAQFGIAGDPTVSSVWRDRAMPDDPVVQSNLRGYVSYAMTGPNARTTQLFVNLIDRADQDSLGFTPIGRVVEGMEVVDRLYAEYGETSGGGMRAGKQAPLFDEGNGYLDRNYPKLDRLVRARVVSPAAP